MRRERPHFVNTAGNGVPRRTGYTYIWSGTSCWKRRLTMKSTNRSAAARCFAPRSTPTNSTCRKQVDKITPTRGTDRCGWLYTTSAGGLDAYDTTIGRFPFPPPALKSPS